MPTAARFPSGLRIVINGEDHNPSHFHAIKDRCWMKKAWHEGTEWEPQATKRRLARPLKKEARWLAEHKKGDLDKYWNEVMSGITPDWQIDVSEYS